MSSPSPIGVITRVNSLFNYKRSLASTAFALPVTWKDVGLSVSIAHPGNFRDRSIGVKEQCSCVLNTYPGNNCQFRLETDASDFATGTVLSILKDDKWHPVAFASHAMSPEEQNYLVADKEMLSIIHSLEQWCHYLEGAHHEFKIWNDHVNLQWFMKRQDLNWHQACWAQYLSCFAFKWTHKAGTTMVKVDALSHQEDHAVSVADDNKGVTVISPKQIHTSHSMDINKMIFDTLVT